MDDGEAIGAIIGIVIIAVVVIFIVYIITLIAIAVATIAAAGGSIWGGGWALLNYGKSMKKNLVDSNRSSATT